MSAPQDSITRLYDLADELNRLAPWEWMEETDLIALRHPATGELGYISTMGAAGNHRALALYVGQEALTKFNLIHNQEGITEDDMMRLVLESRQLQLSFNTRGVLVKEELAEIKTLGRKYRGEDWPRFQSYHPGKAPGPPTHEECIWLTLACEQLLLVAPRLQNENEVTLRFVRKHWEILCRECDKLKIWQDAWIHLDTSIYDFPAPACNELLANRVAKHSQKCDIACLFKILPSVFGAGYGECFCPYVLLVADMTSGMILGVELLSVENQTFEQLIASVPDRFLNLLDKAHVSPLTISCASFATVDLLESSAVAIGVQVDCYESLPMLDSIVASMPF